MNAFKLTFRKLKKSKTETIFGIAGLVTGLVCVLYIFFWINDEVSYNRFNKNIDNMFVVHAYLEGGTKNVDFDGCPPAVGPAIKAEYPEVVNSCRYIPPFIKTLLTAKGNKQMTDVAFSDLSVLDIFTVNFIYGNAGDPDAPNQIVLSETAAHRFFGNTDPIGEIIKFQNEIDLTVVGVIEDIPHNSSVQFEAVIPLQNLKIFYGRDDFLTTWYNNGFTTYGLLSSRDGFEKVSSTITNRIQKELPESTNHLRAYRFEDQYLVKQGNIKNVKIFGFIAILILLAATFNFINLITAKSTKQAKETGLRKTIGATRENLIRLIYTDVAVLCFFAFFLAFVVAMAGLPLFNQAIEKQIEFSSLFTIKPIAILLATFAVTTLLAGSYPAIFLSSFGIVDTLKNNFQTVKGRNIFRNSLLVTIFMASIILLTSTLIISKQTLFLQKMDMGFNQENLLYINLEGKMKEKYQILKEEINRIPGVKASTAVSYLPAMIGNNGEGWNWDGKDPNFKPLVTDYNTDEDLLATLETKIIEGNYFSQDRPGIVINKAFADVIGWDSFVGKSLNAYGNTHTIVGVIDDIRYNSLSEVTRPMVIQPVSAFSASYLMIKSSTDNLSQLINQVQGICQNVEPDFPADYGFVEEEMAKLYHSESRLKRLVGIFSMFSFIVLFLGLLGVIIFITDQKTKEIGVRRVLGAKETSIVASLAKPFAISIAIASAIAVPLTWFAMNRWLENYTYRIDLDFWIFGAGIAVSALLAFFTVTYQSWKAATRNPVEALRYE